MAAPASPAAAPGIRRALPASSSALPYYFAGAGALGMPFPADNPPASVLYMVPADEPTQQRERAAAEKLGLPCRHVAVAAPAGLTLATAEACLAALAALPQPALLACASGNRASALAALAEGRARGWRAEQALAWAAEQRLPFLAVAALREWVAASLAAGAAAAAAAVAASAALAAAGAGRGGGCGEAAGRCGAEAGLEAAASTA